jgi:hypothetical protein
MVRIKSKPKTKKSQETSNTISPANDKRGKLLIQMDEMMETIGNTYGPIVLDELERRIEKTISDFNSDVNEILNSTFKKHASQLKKADEYSKQGLVAETKKESSPNPSESKDDKNIPKYISDYEENQKKKKKK